MADGGTIKAPLEAAYEESGATFLSQQPSVPSMPTKLREMADWPQMRSHLEQRLTSLRTWRNSWWIQNWSDLALFILPRRSIWLTQSAGGWPTPNSMTRGKPINTAIVDPTGTQAFRVCAAGLMSGLASPSRPWFKMVPAIKRFSLDAEGRQWIDEVEDRMYTVLSQSNFYNSFAQECEDVTVFGTATNIMYEDKKDLIRLYNPAIGEFYLHASATMRVDALARMFLQDVDQAVDFFGADHTPDEIKSLWKEKGAQLQTERLVAHMIEPNFEIAPGGVGQVRGNFAWREVYWMFGADAPAPLSIRGFVDEPFTASRWSLQSNDAYGRGVGEDVLPDIMQLQVMTRRKAEGIEKQVRPPLVGDMSLKNQPSSTLPGHVTYVANLGANNGLRPIYLVNPDLQWMIADITAIQQRIQKGAFNDLFLMLEQMPKQKMTAYEVAAKMQEKLQVLGPVIESLITESLKPKLKRVFAIMKRKGFIDPPPPSLQGMPLDIEFVSILALAQKAAATGGLEALAKMIGEMVAVFPDIADNVDPDEFLREYSQLLGNPQKVIRGPEMLAKLREKKAAAQKAQMGMQAGQHMAETAKTGAQAAQVMAGTKIGGGQSALAAMLGGGGGGGGDEE